MNAPISVITFENARRPAEIRARMRELLDHQEVRHALPQTDLDADIDEQLDELFEDLANLVGWNSATDWIRDEHEARGLGPVWLHR